MSLHAAVHRVKGDDRAQVELKVAAIADDLEEGIGVQKYY
jgi:hypothetical protein